jgi:hypothetical protein
MDTLSFLETNLDPWFESEGSQSLVQSGYHRLSDFDNSRMSELAILGRRWGWYDINRPKRTISGYGWVSGHHFHASFVKFSG